MSFGDDGSERSQAVADAVAYADRARRRAGRRGRGRADRAAGRAGQPAAADRERRRHRPGPWPVGHRRHDRRRRPRGLRRPRAARSRSPPTARCAPTAGRAACSACTRSRRPSASSRAWCRPSPGCGCRASFDGDDRYAFLPGTSMAAPQVAAAAALVRSLNPGPDGAGGDPAAQADRPPRRDWEPRARLGRDRRGRRRRGRAAAIDRRARELERSRGSDACADRARSRRHVDRPRTGDAGALARRGVAHRSDVSPRPRPRRRYKLDRDAPVDDDAASALAKPAGLPLRHDRRRPRRQPRGRCRTSSATWRCARRAGAERLRALRPRRSATSSASASSTASADRRRGRTRAS